MAAAPVVDAVIPVAVVDLAAVIPAVGCGSSFCCAVAAEMATDSSAADADATTAVADLTIPVCGSFSFCAAAVDSVPITVAADAAIPAAVVIPAGANLKTRQQSGSLCPGCQFC